MFERTYADVYTGGPEWRDLPIPSGTRYAWNEGSTLRGRPPYFDGMAADIGSVDDVHGARASSRSAIP